MPASETICAELGFQSKMTLAHAGASDRVTSASGAGQVRNLGFRVSSPRGGSEAREQVGRAPSRTARSGWCCCTSQVPPRIRCGSVDRGGRRPSANRIGQTVDTTLGYQIGYHRMDLQTQRSATRVALKD